MADKAPKGGKRLVNRNKRHRQNLRTFAHVQARRLKHALAHGMKVGDIWAKRWITPPQSKATGSF